MFVAIDGIQHDGTACERSWHMLAEGDAGPLIPSMAVAAVIRNCLDGRRPAPGARPATADLELGDYEPLFSRYGITTGTRETGPPATPLPLFRRLLGELWAELPVALRAIHGGNTMLTAEGVATVERGGGLLSRLVARLFGFPRAGENVPVRVTFERQPGGEVWRRSFAGHPFESRHSEGKGRAEHLLCETFGPLRFGMALVVEDGRLRYVLRNWSLFGLPLPRLLAPGGPAEEIASDGRFHFDVTIGHPLTGLIVRYRGWLVPQTGSVAGQNLDRA
jgi:hypothetical protein